MIDYLVRRLRQAGALSTGAELAIPTWMDRRVRLCGAREDVFRPQDLPETVRLITAGIACRYRFMPNGQRQITGFLLPGDLFALRSLLGAPFDHYVRSLTMLETMQLERSCLRSFTDQRSDISEVLQRAMSLQSAITREWAVNVGQRSAMERIAHLFCELFARLQTVGLTMGNRCLLPLTQVDIAEALALTPVHVNRMVMLMTRSGWLTFQRSVLQIHDMRCLTEVGGFDPTYLEVDATPAAAARSSDTHVSSMSTATP